MTHQKEVIYSNAVIEFVTVAVEFSSILESDKPETREVWIDQMLKVLPLLYIKASLLPATVEMNDTPPEVFVREIDYNRVAHAVATIMGEENVYLDVFVEDMKYSDRPVSAFVSEDIADIYQDVRNLVSVYQHNLADQMNDALFICQQNFKTYWGQKLINVLRPLHNILYKMDEQQEDTDIDHTDGFNMEGMWD